MAPGCFPYPCAVASVDGLVCLSWCPVLMSYLQNHHCENVSELQLIRFDVKIRLILSGKKGWGREHYTRVSYTVESTV